MKDGKKYEGALIISPREKSDELLRFRKEFPEIDFSFMDLKEAEKLFLNQSDSRALRVLLAKGYSLEKSKDILSALRYFKENHEEDEKLKELSGLPMTVTAELLQRLHDTGLINVCGEYKEENTVYQPSMGTNNISLGLMVDRLESNGKWKPKVLVAQLNGKLWRKVYQIRKEYGDNLKTILVRDL